MQSLLRLQYSSIQLSRLVKFLILWIFNQLIITNSQVNELPERVTELLNIEKRYYCKEDWGYANATPFTSENKDSSHAIDQGRLYYSLAVAGVQFLLPSGVLMFVHARIYHRLTQLPFWSSRVRSHTTAGGQRSHSAVGGQQQLEGRGQKTLYLLISVVVVFMCSWLPLNLINILNDVGILDKLLK